MSHITSSVVSTTFVSVVGCQFYTERVERARRQADQHAGVRVRSCLFTGIEIAGTSTSNRIVNCLFYNKRREINVTGGADQLLVQGCRFMEDLLGSPLSWIEIAGASNGIRIVDNHFWGRPATVPVVRLDDSAELDRRQQRLLQLFPARCRDRERWVGRRVRGARQHFPARSNHDSVLRNSTRCSDVGNTFFSRSTDEPARINTYANIRIIDEFGLNRGTNNSITGNQSLDTATSITYVVEADAGCQNNIMIGNSGTRRLLRAGDEHRLVGNTPWLYLRSPLPSTSATPWRPRTDQRQHDITSITASYAHRP